MRPHVLCFPHHAAAPRRWLKVSKRIYTSFGSACWPTGACSTLHHHASPSRSSRLLMWKLDDVCLLLTQWSWLFQQRVVQRSMIERFRWQLRGAGTPYRLPSELHRHLPCFGRRLNRQSSFPDGWFKPATCAVCLYSAPVTLISALF